MLPFTHEQFLAVFAAYNAAVWPAQVAAYGVGAAICAAIGLRRAFAPAFVSIGLAAMWLFTGVAYHWTFFLRVNAAAGAFGAAFVAQAALFVFAASRGSLQFPVKHRRLRNLAGWMLIAYSMLLYPVIGEITGVRYPAAPVFGITPCPLTIFSFGVFLLARSAPWWLLPIPIAWAALGGTAAWQLSIAQDWALPLSAAVMLGFVLAARKHSEMRCRSRAEVPSSPSRLTRTK